MAKRIMVTGGAGFLGSHLCEALLNEGHEVLCIDNLLTGTKRNVEFLSSTPRFTFIEHNVVEPFYFEVDQIYNLACAASPVHYQKRPITTLKTAVIGMINVLEIARKSGATVVQASTSEVYGDPKVHPQKEDYTGCVNITGIRACYDEGKRCAETLCFDYHRQYDVPIKVARIFNTYGPRMKVVDGRVVSNLITQALKGEDLTIYGDGMQTRSFCFYRDLIEGLMQLMNAEASITGPMNLGNPTELTVLLLAEHICALTKTRSTIAFKPLPQDDPTRRRPVITKAKLELGWEPRISLEEGLRETIAYFEEEINRAHATV